MQLAKLTAALIVCTVRAALLQGEVQVSPLHPRIYVRNDSAQAGKGLTVAELRRRLSRAEYTRWRRPAPGRGVAAIVERASRYLEDGNAVDLEIVREFLKTRTFSYAENDVGGFLAGAEMATAFDWVYGGLSEADRSAAMKNIVTTAESSRNFLLRGGPDINHNYTYMALSTVAVCGLVLRGEPEPYNEKAQQYLALARDFLESPGKVLDTWKAREGAWAEGSHYTFHETLRNLVMMLAAYRSASDLDYFTLVEQRYGDFLAKAGRFLIASTRPDMTFERVGDCSPSRVQANITVPVTVEALAAGLSDAGEAARLRSFADALRRAYGDKAVHPAFDWGMRIFFDPRSPRSPSYRTLPLVMRMGPGTDERIVFRNGWGPDSTQVTILAGDHFSDHQHFDKGHFLIYHRGGLVIDGGAYDGMYRQDAHPNEYASRTLAHNCVLVYDPDQSFPKGYTNDGGQNVLRGKQHHYDWPSYVEHRQREGLDTGNVLAYDDSEPNEYGYVSINLVGAYSGKVTRYDRQFVYLRASDSLSVFDRVSAAEPGFSKRWLLHFQDVPSIDGKIPEAGVRTFSNARLTTLRRRGQWDPGGGAVSYDGVLFVQNFLPEARDILAVGGPGYEYFNTFNGVNYPPSKPAVAAPVRESGTWRIEIVPRNASKEDQFLNVLQMADSPAEQPVETRLITSAEGKLVGVQILSSPENQIVLFARSQNGGPVSLPVSYEISSAGPADHLLAEMSPGREVIVEFNHRLAGIRRVNAHGVLRFRDTGRGVRSITIKEK